MSIAKRNGIQYFVMSFQPIQAAIFLSIGMPLFFFTLFALFVYSFVICYSRFYLNIEIISVV